MQIVPAIDIKNRACVRLYQGELATAEQVADSALEAAKSFRAAGAEWVHMVDLDGAVEGARKNTGVFLEVARKSGLKVEVGGGIRTISILIWKMGFLASSSAPSRCATHRSCGRLWRPTARKLP